MQIVVAQEHIHTHTYAYPPTCLHIYFRLVFCFHYYNDFFLSICLAESVGYMWHTPNGYVCTHTYICWKNLLVLFRRYAYSYCNNYYYTFHENEMAKYVNTSRRAIINKHYHRNFIIIGGLYHICRLWSKTKIMKFCSLQIQIESHIQPIYSYMMFLVEYK